MLLLLVLVVIFIVLFLICSRRSPKKIEDGEVAEMTAEKALAESLPSSPVVEIKTDNNKAPDAKDQSPRPQRTSSIVRRESSAGLVVPPFKCNFEVDEEEKAKLEATAEKIVEQVRSMATDRVGYFVGRKPSVAQRKGSTASTGDTQNSRVRTTSAKSTGSTEQKNTDSPQRRERDRVGFFAARSRRAPQQPRATDDSQGNKAMQADNQQPQQQQNGKRNRRRGGGNRGKNSGFVVPLKVVVG